MLRDVLPCVAAVPEHPTRTSAPPRRLTSDACAACSGRPQEPGQPFAVPPRPRIPDPNDCASFAAAATIRDPPQPPSRFAEVETSLGLSDVAASFRCTDVPRLQVNESTRNALSFDSGFAILCRSCGATSTAAAASALEIDTRRRKPLPANLI